MISGMPIVGVGSKLTLAVLSLSELYDGAC